jgi:hypothetical protein
MRSTYALVRVRVVEEAVVTVTLKAARGVETLTVVAQRWH